MKVDFAVISPTVSSGDLSHCAMPRATQAGPIINIDCVSPNGCRSAVLKFQPSPATVAPMRTRLTAVSNTF